MKKLLLGAALTAGFGFLSSFVSANTEDCYYTDIPVKIYTVECEYEAGFEYYGLPNYNLYPNGPTSCPINSQRNVSLEKDLTTVRTVVGEGSVPSCGSRWMSYDWNGSHTVNDHTCGYWWREGANITGYADKITETTETRRRLVCR